MPHVTSLAIAAGLAVAGAAIGTQLGRSTAAAINPAYFQDPQATFYSDLAPGAQRQGDWDQAQQAQEYQASQQVAPPAGCPDCTWPTDPAPRQDPVVARYDAPEAAPPPREEAEAPVRIVVVEQPAEPARDAVARYSGYQVDRNGDPAPATEGDQGGGTTQ
jgi:hypothetical protein